MYERTNMSKIVIKDLGEFDVDCGLIGINECSDGFNKVGKDGVKKIYATGDRKVELLCYEDHTVAYVLSAIGYPAYYPLHAAEVKKPIKAVLMDLDGTSVKSEEFWIWIIQKSIASLLGDENFTLDESDLPHVSGHSVSEHLQYCINKYCPGASLEKAREYYFMHTHREMNEIMEGRGKEGAFTPSPGLKPFLYRLKELGIKIGLVTSGLYEKAYPEILSAFNTLEMGDPKQFYDCIISAGFPLRKGEVGTLGERSRIRGCTPRPAPSVSISRSPTVNTSSASRTAARASAPSASRATPPSAMTAVISSPPALRLCAISICTALMKFSNI